MAIVAAGFEKAATLSASLPKAEAAHAARRLGADRSFGVVGRADAVAKRAPSAVRLFVHAHLWPNAVGTEQRRRDLQGEPLLAGAAGAHGRAVAAPLQPTGEVSWCSSMPGGGRRRVLFLRCAGCRGAGLDQLGPIRLQLGQRRLRSPPSGWPLARPVGSDADHAGWQARTAGATEPRRPVLDRAVRALSALRAGAGGGLGGDVQGVSTGKVKAIRGAVRAQLFRILHQCHQREAGRAWHGSPVAG